MKFKFIPILILTTLLAGCDVIEFTNESHKPGLEGSIDSKTKIITYFDGDNIDKNALTAHELTFIAEEDEAVIDKQNPNKLKDYIVDADNIVANIDRAEEISTFYHFEENANLGNGIKIGYPSDLVDGRLNFSFSVKVRACEVYGYIRYGLLGVEEGNKIVVDENVALSANGSRFIRLPYKDKFEELEQKVCSFNFANEENILELCAYGKRAVITKIVIYS